MISPGPSGAVDVDDAELCGSGKGNDSTVVEVEVKERCKSTMSRARFLTEAASREARCLG